MKLTALHLKNFLSHRSLNLELHEKISILVGRNGTGKSSILDSIRCLLTGSCRGVPRGEAKALATWGSDSFRVEGDIDVAGSHATLRRTATTLSRIDEDGKAIKLTQADLEAKVTKNPKALEAVLDVWRALDMTPDERKALVFDLAGIEVTQEALAEKGLDGSLWEMALDGNWRKAERYSAEQKRDANRLAKEILIPEVQDIDLGGGAMVSSVTDEELADHREQLDALATREHDLANELMKLKARDEVGVETLRKAKAEKEEELQAIPVDDLEKTAAKLAKALSDEHGLRKATEEALQELEEDHRKARAEREGAESKLESWKRATAAHACPDCGLEHEPPDPPLQKTIDAAANEREDAEQRIVSLAGEIEEGGKVLEKAQKNIAKLTAEKTTIDEQLVEAERIRRGLAEWEKKIAALEGEDAPDPAALEKELEDVRARVARGGDVVRAVEGYRIELDRAKDAEDQRSKLLHEGAAWERQEKLCRPDGIQAELLGPALDPIRERLRRWDDLLAPHREVRLTDDFDVEVYSGRDGSMPVSLLSSSERWRVGLALADALAQLSGLRFLALDETTLLDQENRDALLEALLSVADDYDQVLVVAVLGEKRPKQAPEGLGVRVYTVGEDGVVPVPAAKPAEEADRGDA